MVKFSCIHEPEGICPWSSIARLSRCIGALMELQHNFDEGLRMANPLSDQQSKPKTMEDIKLVVKELQSQQVFQSQGARCHAQLPNLTPLLFHGSAKQFSTYGLISKESDCCTQSLCIH